MELMTKELAELFKQFPQDSQEGKGGSAEVIVKYFNPCGAGTWFIIEAEKHDDDYELFGFCHLGTDDYAELGYIMLSELINIQLPFGLRIERDLYLPKGITLKEAIENACFAVPSYLKKTD